MSISTEARSSQLLVSDGSTKTYAFTFKVFDAGTDITIYEATGESSEKVMSSDLYSVTLNEDQEGYPGGSVTFATAPAADLKFRIVSSIPYLQKTQLMNLGSFSPKTLNEVFDKLCALIQQVRLLADRALVVPYTQGKTPQEVLAEVLESAATAIEYAQLAADSRQACEEIKQNIFQYSWDIPHVVETLRDVENYPYDGMFAVAGFGNPGQHGEDISNRVVTAGGSTEPRTLADWASDIVELAKRVDELEKKVL